MLVRNLLDNAVKYTGIGGGVSITLLQKRLIISDTGPGIANEEKSRVFNRFVRIDKTGQTGSGLGLSIARWIADAHGISISLNDNTPHGLVVELDFTS